MNNDQFTHPDHPTATAPRVLPDDVIRDARSDAVLLHITLRPDATIAELEQFNRQLTDAVALLHTDGADGTAVASATVAMGRRFFVRLPVQPAELVDPPPVAEGEYVDADVLVYVMFREESRLAEFVTSLAAIGNGLITSVVSHRGYQRADGRELGGFHDGLRNAKHDRAGIVFVDRDRQPDEPPAAHSGSYVVTMRIPQNLTAWAAIAETEQEQIVGRRKADGSRLDQPVGTPVDTEPVITSGCPLNSHVAKSGPRGELHDRTQIFRRGVPYTELTSAGTIDAGLLFVSFQASLEQFTTVLDEWMRNPDFPTTGTGPDALIARGLISITHTGFYFVPAPAEFIGAQFFTDTNSDDRCRGRIVVRKKLLDPSGNPVRGERGGFIFQLIDAAGTPTGATFITDSTGRAVSPPVPSGETYTLREVAVNGPFTTAPDTQVTLTGRRAQVQVVNIATVTDPGYGR